MKNFLFSSICIILILFNYSYAQFGAVGVQPDTIRFINASQKYGLLMPQQQMIVGKLDTIITSANTNGGNAYKVITGSLLNYDDNCVGAKIVNGEVDCSGSYAAWREYEKSTSWYQADRGDTSAAFPTNYVITISTGQDSVVIWDRDTAELWMAFGGNNNNLLRPDGTGEATTDIVFKDGILYSSADAGYAFSVFDFLIDQHHLYAVAGKYEFNVNTQNRNNGAAAITLLNSSHAIANNTVNAVAVTRDPFGLTDELGRIKHWWVVGLSTNTSISIFNPHTGGIYDGPATSGDQIDIDLNKTGELWGSYNNSGLEDSMQRWGSNPGGSSIFGFSSDGVLNRQMTWTPTGVGAVDLAWPSTPLSTKVLATDDGLSVIGGNSNRAFFYNSQGVYVMHPPRDGYFVGSTWNNRSAKQRFSNTVNAPVEFGDALLAMAFEGDGTDSSPYGHNLTVNGSPGYVSAVFGQGYSSVSSSYYNLTDPDFALGANTGGQTSFYLSMWFKSASATNPSANEYLAQASSGATDYWHLILNTSGQLNFAWVDPGSQSSTVTSSSDFYDGQWHHVFAEVIDRGGFDAVTELWVDGVLVSTTTNANDGTQNSTQLTLFSNLGNAGHFNGFGDEVVYGITGDKNGAGGVAHIVAAKIHAEGRKKLNMGTPSIPGRANDALHAVDVDYVDALDNGLWLAGNQDSLTIFDGRIPIKTYGTPGGAIKDAKLIQNPGADDVGLVVATNEKLQFIQPNVNIEEAYLSRVYNNQPILIGETVVVDSSGVGGIFWSANDAIAAAANADRSKILVNNGTYGGFSIDGSNSENGLNFQCVGARHSIASAQIGVLFNGGGTAPALTLAGNVDISNCSFYTAPGGGGGGHAAVSSTTGSNARFHNNIILDSDFYGIYWNSSLSHIYSNQIVGADEAGIYLCCAQADGNTVFGNVVGGINNFSIAVEAGADFNTVVGNSGDLSNSNAGTGNTFTGNSEF